MRSQVGFADVNSTRLYYEVAGTGNTLVFIHGFACNMHFWDDQFEVFAQSYKVVRYDARGFGKSANPTEEPYSHYDDLKALLEFLDLPRAHLVGHSMGSRTALHLALTHPDMARSVIHVTGSPGGFEWPQDELEQVQQVFTAANEAAQTSGVKAANEILMQLPHLKATRQNPHAGPRLHQIFMDFPGWHWSHDDPEFEIDPPAVERLDQLKVPLCMIVGEKDLRVYQLATDFVQQHVPMVEVNVIPDVGHAVNMEAPERFNEVVLRFLAQV
jgi:3-oxoadipate enol-lactonase